MVCKDPEIKEHLIHAGDEETDHLIWCKKRLDELDGKPSVLNPIWYAGSFAIGAIFGSLGEKTSLGFVEETENQVVIDRSFLKIDVLPTTASLYRAELMGYFGNNVLPLRLGELMRAYLIGREWNLSKSYVFGTIVLERILDTISVAFLSFLLRMAFSQYSLALEIQS